MPNKGTRAKNYNSKLHLLQALSEFIVDEIGNEKSEIKRFLLILIKKLRRKSSNAKHLKNYSQEIKDSINNNGSSNYILEKIFSSNCPSISRVENCLGFSVFNRSSTDMNDVVTRNRNCNTEVLDLPVLPNMILTGNKFDEKISSFFVTENIESIETPQQTLGTESTTTRDEDWRRCKGMKFRDYTAKPMYNEKTIPESLDNLNTFFKPKSLPENDKDHKTWEQITRINATRNNSDMEENRRTMRRNVTKQRRMWTLHNKMTEIHSNSINDRTIRVYNKRPQTSGSIDCYMDELHSSNHDNNSEDIIQLYDKVTDLILKKYKRLNRRNLEEFKSFLENKSHSKKDLTPFETSTTLTPEMPSWAVRGLLNENRGTPIDLFGIILDRMSDYLIMKRGRIIKEDIEVFMQMLSHKMIEQATFWRRTSLHRIYRSKAKDYSNINTMENRQC